MERYIVMELQTDADGRTATLTNTFGELNLAQQKYYTICAAAVVSEIPYHSAAIIHDGIMIEGQVFNRRVEEEEEKIPIEE